MEKSIFSKEYQFLLQKLREARESKGLTQTHLARKLDQTQSFISKVERGERRLDVVELRAFCLAIGVSFESFVREVNTLLNGGQSK